MSDDLNNVPADAGADDDALLNAAPADDAGQPPANDPAADPPSDDDAAPAKPKKSAQERINELTAARREAEREAEFWRIKALESRPTEQPQQQAPAGDGKPDPSKYEAGEYDPRYIEDLIDWKAEQKLTSRLQETEAQRQARERAATFQAQIKAASEKHDDFEDKVLRGAQRGSWACTPDMLETMQESDMGAEVAYHLASNPAEAQRIASLTPRAQAREIGRIEAMLSQPSKPKAKTVSDAPEPVASARGNNGRFTVNPDTDDFAAFEKQYGDKG
jgi:hypothetical protein